MRRAIRHFNFLNQQALISEENKAYSTYSTTRTACGGRNGGV